ncbi:pirin family protein [Vibrio sp. DW001]|uniref:pirin family protein n=1 Tax=Vibrio sp. DW001 TaxID=2912315 RepID=UPI0023B10A74|nr:pirin family protein [Vibrio sp. DW001]WED25611.1 pirin family protein [Vibrio sp. DW001]
MITVRNAQDRGHANLGWLESKHTFSFGHYHDPKHMGFSALRVINDDIVKPGAGFDTHGHRDMEIVSYVLEGSIEHKDSEGNVQVLPAGEFQLMSAGRGIYHSEYNASQNENLKFLQIWIQPNTFGKTPGYQQKNFGKENGLTLIISADGKDGALSIKQDASLYQLILDAGQSIDFDIEDGRNVYLHQIRGKLQIDNTFIEAGSGAKVEQQNKVRFMNGQQEQVTALLFDLP